MKYFLIVASFPLIFFFFILERGVCYHTALYQCPLPLICQLALVTSHFKHNAAFYFCEIFLFGVR